MRISHKRKKEEPKKIFFYNEGITVPQVFVLNSDGSNAGIMNTGEAIRLAREQDMDLVQINPKAEPPVVKIMNYSHFQYQQEKESRLRKAHQHVSKVKCVRLSLRIGKHDSDIRKDQAIKFMDDGDKVKIELLLRGRENQQAALGFNLVRDFIKDINATTPTRFDQATEKQGSMITAIITKA